MTIEQVGEEWVVRIERSGAAPQQFRCASEAMAKKLVATLGRMYGARSRAV